MSKRARPKNPLQRGRLGVFDDNRARPFHRWFPFVEGYSAELVDQALDGASPDTVLFDPFGGSGTTSLAAAVRGFDSVFTEVNPYMAWIADVKINRAREAVQSHAALKSLEDLAGRVPSAALPSVDSGHPLMVADRVRNYFPEGRAEELLGLHELIADSTDGPIREVAGLALAACIIPSSFMVRRTDLRRRTPTDPGPTVLRELFAKKLAEFGEDLVRHGHSIQGSASRIGSDVRSDWTSPKPIDLVVTSPPYLNGTNYCRNSKLELLALGLISSEKELAQLRVDSISAGINNVSRRRHVPTRFDSVEAVAEVLDQVAYDQRIPVLVRTYFADMALGLAQTHRNAREGARLLLDIGDSRYCGVHVPTHDLLVEVAQTQGWAFKEQQLIRTRRSFDGTQLVQVLLHFEAVS